MLKSFLRGGMPGGKIRAPWPIYFIRHGQTDWNADRRFQGHADIPLNALGQKQALRNGKILAQEIRNLNNVSFYSSPLIRARQTLEIIREQLGLPKQRYMIDDRLIEIDLGLWNGKTPEEINAEDPGAFERRNEDKWNFVLPDGESYAGAASRTRDFLTHLNGPTVITGHGASGRLLRGYLCGLKREDVPHLPAPQDVIFKLHHRKETKI